MILDEPTNGLDVMATRAMRDVILQMKEGGVLFSSHIMQKLRLYVIDWLSSLVDEVFLSVV